jgi:hypothetical protein
MSDVKYPKIKVKLSGTDGNVFAILGTVRKAMKRGGVTTAELKAFTDEAMSGDYSHALATCMNT